MTGAPVTETDGVAVMFGMYTMSPWKSYETGEGEGEGNVESCKARDFSSMRPAVECTNTFG